MTLAADPTSDAASGGALVLSWTEPARLPLVVGVAGHRLLNSEDHPVLEQEVRSFLRSLWPGDQRDAYTPYLLTSLAEGADRLVADVALQEGWRLVCPLPLLPTEFEQDFPSSISHFRTLLAQTSHWYTVPGEATTRPAVYAQAATFIAAHAQVMLVLWDGSPFTPGKEGGTAHTVALRSEDAYPHPDLLSSDECVGPTYRIHVPGEPGISRLPATWLPLTGRDPQQEVYGPQGLLKELREFNKQARDDLNHHQDKLRREVEALGSVPASEQEVVKLFAFAAVASGNNQRSKFNWLLTALGIAMLGGVAKESLGLFGPVLAGRGRIAAVVALAVATLIISAVTGWRRHERHIGHRALAETLRVGLALRLSGRLESPTRLVPAHLQGSQSRLSDLVAGLWSILPPPQLQPAHAWDVWIQGQLGYLRSKLEKGERSLALQQRFTHIPFGVAVVFSVIGAIVGLSGSTALPLIGLLTLVAVFALTLHWVFNRQLVDDRLITVRYVVLVAATLIILGLATAVKPGASLSSEVVIAFCAAVVTVGMLVIGSASYYAQKRSLEEDHFRYLALHALYERVTTMGAKLSPSQRLSLVSELAREAMIELVTWCNTLQSRRPEVPKG